MANEDRNPKQNPENPNEDVPNIASESPSPTNQDNTSRPINDTPRASSQQEVNYTLMHEKSPSEFAGISSPPSKGKKKVASSGSTSGTITKQRKKPEFKRSPACHICSKEFVSWPAVFGHMRCHKDRQWRGAFPPPVWSNVDRDVIAEEAAAALVQAAKDAQLMMENQSGATPAAVVLSPNRERINIDLNEHQEDVGSSESASKEDCVAKFDLNMPPPEEDDDVGGAAV